MAQSGYTPISLYFSATGAAVPIAGNLVAGELALNTNDGKLYYKNSSGVVTLLAGATAGPAGGSTTQVQYNNAGVLAGITGATTNGTALTLVAPVLGTPASGIVTNLTGTASININGTVGATTANTGAFTTLAASGDLTLSGANGKVSAGTTTTGGYFANSTSTAFYVTYGATHATLANQLEQRGDTQTFKTVGGTTIAAMSSALFAVTGAVTVSTTLAASGRVSLGSSPPATAALAIKADTSANAISIAGRAADGVGNINFFANDGTTYQGYISAVSTGVNFGIGGGTIFGYTTTGLSITGTLGVTGLITSTAGNNAQVFRSASATTGYQYCEFANTGSTLRFGIDSSTGGSLFTGGGAYSANIGTTSATSFQIGTNGVVRMTIDSAGAVTLPGVAATLRETLLLNGSTTAGNYATLSNTGANLRLGIDNSAGTALITGGTAYGSIVGSNNATTLHLITNGTSRIAINSAGAVTIPGTLGVTGIGTFSAGAQGGTVASIIATGPSTNSVIDVFNGYNPNVGNASTTRLSLGTSLGSVGASFTKWGVNHSTRPNYVSLWNENTSVLSLSGDGGSHEVLITSTGVTIPGLLGMGPSGNFQAGQSAGVGYLGMLSNADMYFYTNNAERMRISAAGAVTIGGTLDVTGGITGSSFLKASQSLATPAGGTSATGIILGTATVQIIWGSGAPTANVAKGSLYLRTDGSGINDRMYINTNGTTTWTAVVTVA